MQASEQIAIESLLELPHVLVHEVFPPEKKLITEGEGSIGNIPSFDCTLLQVNNFRYTLSKELPVLIDKQVHPRLYILPNLDSNYCLAIPNRNPEEAKIVEEFERILGECCIIVDVKAENDEKSKEKLKTKGEKASNFVIASSDKIKDSMIAAATALSKHFKTGENFLKTRIKVRKQAEIKPETIGKVRIANTVTNCIHTYTKAQVEAAVKISKDLLNEAGNQFKNSKKGQKMAESKYYDPAVKIGGASIHALACLYVGMIESLDIMGKELASCTNNLVEYKYGEKAGEISKNAFETAGNITSITKMYKQAAARGILDENGNKEKNLK